MSDSRNAPLLDPRPALFAAILLTFLGVSGLGNGLRAYRAEGVSPTDEIAQDEAQRLQQEAVMAIRSAPVQRPLGAMNVVVSGLLLLASFALTLRRKWSLWLIRQAILVNVLYIVVATVCDIQTLRGLTEIAVRQAVLMNLSAADAWLVQTLWGSGVVIVAMFNIGLHLFIGRRAKRPAVVEFLDG